MIQTTAAQRMVVISPSGIMCDSIWTKIFITIKFTLKSTHVWSLFAWEILFINTQVSVEEMIVIMIHVLTTFILRPLLWRKHDPDKTIVCANSIHFENLFNFFFKEDEEPQCWRFSIKNIQHLLSNFFLCNG